MGRTSPSGGTHPESPDGSGFGTMRGLNSRRQVSRRGHLAGKMSRHTRHGKVNTSRSLRSQWRRKVVDEIVIPNVLVGRRTLYKRMRQFHTPRCNATDDHELTEVL
jgi:hypothetical protein